MPATAQQFQPIRRTPRFGVYRPEEIMDLRAGSLADLHRARRSGDARTTAELNADFCCQVRLQLKEFAAEASTIYGIDREVLYRYARGHIGWSPDENGRDDISDLMQFVALIDRATSAEQPRRYLRAAVHSVARRAGFRPTWKSRLLRVLERLTPDDFTALVARLRMFAVSPARN